MGIAVFGGSVVSPGLTVSAAAVIYIYDIYDHRFRLWDNGNGRVPVKE